MPTRISAGVSYHPCFFTFYLYDPYRLQNYKFFLILANEYSYSYWLLTVEQRSLVNQRVMPPHLTCLDYEWTCSCFIDSPAHQSGRYLCTNDP